MNILFVTSFSTGQGHKSITEAIRSQIARQAPHARITVVDGFAIGNWLSRASGKVYNNLALYAPRLWGAIYRWCDFARNSTNKLTAKCIREGFIECLDENSPDVIVSVHAAFVGSILRILSEERRVVPVISVIADLDNVTSLWHDPRVHSILCPTLEASKRMLALGLPEDKVKIFGFPVRDEFLSAKDEQKDESGPLKALLISGSQGSKKTRAIVKSLMDSKSCSMRIITGSNALLKSMLELLFAKHIGKGIEIMGFTKEVEKCMREADFLIARASPNVLMEAINLEKPLVITETFYGQERKNPKFILKHNLGIVCRSPKKLPKAISGMMEDGATLFNSIKGSQRNYKKPEAAAHIAEHIIEAAQESMGPLENASGWPQSPEALINSPI
jgi:processive 1,2-diacylglycerol beta-glucosyltransferase